MDFTWLVLIVTGSYFLHRYLCLVFPRPSARNVRAKRFQNLLVGHRGCRGIVEQGKVGKICNKKYFLLVFKL